MGKVKSAAQADLAVQAQGAQPGRPFQWDGQLRSRNLNAPNIYSGTGIPTASTIPGQGRVGDFYFRVDGIAGAHLYFCTTAGIPGIWAAIA